MPSKRERKQTKQFDPAVDGLNDSAKRKSANPAASVKNTVTKKAAVVAKKAPTNKKPAVKISPAATKVTAGSDEATDSELDKWLNVWMDNGEDITMVPMEWRARVLETHLALQASILQWKIDSGGGHLMMDSEDEDSYTEDEEEEEAEPTTANGKAYKAIMQQLDGEFFPFEVRLYSGCCRVVGLR
jgi:hypothetical protein